MKRRPVPRLYWRSKEFQPCQREWRVPPYSGAKHKRWPPYKRKYKVKPMKFIEV